MTNTTVERDSVGLIIGFFFTALIALTLGIAIGIGISDGADYKHRVYICPKCSEKIYPDKYIQKPQEKLYELKKGE